MFFIRAIGIVCVVVFCDSAFCAFVPVLIIFKETGPCVYGGLEKRADGL